MANDSGLGGPMGLADFSVVDVVTRLPGATERAALIIRDDGKVTDESTREMLLRQKLAAYLLFVKSGQFERSYPELAHHQLSFEVVCQTSPTSGMTEIRQVVDGDLTFSVTVLTEAEFLERLSGYSPRE